MKKIILISSIVLGVIIIGVGAYMFTVYHSVEKTAHDIYKPLKTTKVNTKPVLAPKTKKETAKPISILLLGVDQRKHDKGRSDTMIVLTLNPETHTMQMVSIPRDTRALLGHTGTIDKINAAYFYGGPDLSVQTVDQFLNIKVDYYIRINMQGLRDLVNSLGGITVDNPFAWHDEGYYKKGYLYEKGMIHLNGPQAVGYVRMRHLDPKGDFGRNNRQRQVIKAVVDKAANFSTFTKYQDILDAIKKNVITNISFDEMKYIVRNYRSAKDHIINYEVKGHGKIINKLWYLVVNDQERKKVSNMIKSQLQVPDGNVAKKDSNGQDSSSSASGNEHTSTNTSTGSDS